MVGLAGRRPRWVLPALLVVLGPLVVAAIFLRVQHDANRKDQAYHARERAESLAGVLAAQSDAIVATLRIATYVPVANADTVLWRLRDSLPIAGELERFDAQGTMVASSARDPQGRTLNRGDRAWFREARDGGMLTISDSYRQRGSGQWIVTIAHGGPDQHVNAFTFAADALQQRLREAAPGGAAFLVGSNGTVIASSVEGWEGRNLARGTLQIPAAAASERLREMYAMDDMSLSAAQPVARTPWYVVVALPSTATGIGGVPVWIVFGVLAALVAGACAVAATVLRSEPAPSADPAITAASDVTWRHAIDAMDLSAWGWDVAAGRVHYSPKYLANLGLPPDELTPSLEDWQSRLHPDDVAAVMAAVEAHASGAAPAFRSEYRIRHSDGSWRWVRDQGFATERDPQGRALRMVGWHEDLTAQRSAESAVAKNDGILRALYERGPHAIIVYSFTSGKLITANPAALIRTGFTASEIAGRTATELGLWVDGTDRVRLYDALVQGGRAANMEIRIRAKNGEELDWIVFAERIPGDDGDDLVLTHSIDVTAERRAQAALRESTQLFRAVFEESPYPIIVTRVSDGRIQMASNTFCREVGYSLAEVLGRTTAELDIWGLREQRAEMLAQLARDGNVSNVEMHWKDRAGGEHVTLANAIVFESRGERFVLGMGADITERKRAEESLRRLRALLDETGRVARVGGWVYEVDTDRILWTDEALRLHDFPPGTEPSAEEVLSHYPEETRRRFRSHMVAATRDGVAWDDELEVRSRSGRTFWARAMGRAEQVDGRTVRLYGAFQDVTERVQARFAVERLSEELEGRVAARTSELKSAVAELEAYSASVAKDLGAPLRAAEASLRLVVESSGELPEDAKAFLAQAKGSLERARAAAAGSLRKTPRKGAGDS